MGGGGVAARAGGFAGALALVCSQRRRRCIRARRCGQRWPHGLGVGGRLTSYLRDLTAFFAPDRFAAAFRGAFPAFFAFFVGFITVFWMREAEFGSRNT